MDKKYRDLENDIFALKQIGYTAEEIKEYIKIMMETE